MSGGFPMQPGGKKTDDAMGGLFEAVIEWESSISQDAAQDEANAELRNRRGEINTFRQQYPKSPVYVHIFATIEKFAPDGPKIWRFRTIVVSLSRYADANVPPRTGKVYHKTITMPPWAQSSVPKAGSAKPAWEHRYQGAFTTALVIDRSERAALAVLNGSSMHDLLRMLRKLALDGRYFVRLYSLAGTANGVGRSRLLVAFAAVMAFRKGGDALTVFQERMSDVVKLPPEQQKDILEFLGEATTLDETKARVGTWRVKVGKWTWRYTFDIRAEKS